MPAGRNPTLCLVGRKCLRMFSKILTVRVSDIPRPLSGETVLQINILRHLGGCQEAGFSDVLAPGGQMRWVRDIGEATPEVRAG